MPKGPKGEKRPADVIGAAVKVAKIATGEIEEDVDDDGVTSATGRRGGCTTSRTGLGNPGGVLAPRYPKAIGRHVGLTEDTQPPGAGGETRERSCCRPISIAVT